MSDNNLFEMNCKKHGLTSFFEKTDGKKRCKKCASEAVVRCRQNSKQKLVEKFGGSCSNCGYDKCQQALQFHHINPENKKFNISKKGMCRNWDALLEEANKCVLLCANCHIELHHMKKISSKEKKDNTKYCVCGNKMFKTSKQCKNCFNKVIKPDKNDLQKIVLEMPITKVAKKYKVSDKTILNWCDSYDINRPSRGYWLKKNKTLLK